ncbi:immunity 49 family protein [Actinomadura rupiterrae]|uniref:immunity 49 family protein n=1 Tax=Actinomadura rupiterrae TaxID=559627 RepID=UPI0020A40ACA|nr:immunity 49 family protein [Actinomadura rupiterrae]MCP2339962.1 hypothetical protein [Actinomadura rupiterrae]
MRHHIPDEALEAALAAVPEQLAEDADRAENGGPTGIELLADMLADYAAARTTQDDPRAETPETWRALRSAASLYCDYVAANATRSGQAVKVQVDYLGVGFSFVKDVRTKPNRNEWLHAWHMALLFDHDLLNPLVKPAARFKKDGYIQALVSYRAGTKADLTGVGSEGDLLLAIIDRDADVFNAALAGALEAHREQASVLPRSLIAWGPLAMAVLARAAGLTVEVASDYLPEGLLLEAGPVPPVPDGPIPRPAADAWEVNQELLRERVDLAFSAKAPDHRRLSAIGDAADLLGEALAGRALSDPQAETPEWRRDLDAQCEAYTALFALASAPKGTPIQITLDGRTEEMPASGPGWFASTGRFVHAVTLAFAARADDLTAVLAAVDPAGLGLGDNDTGHYVLALHALLDNADPRPHLDRALSARRRDRTWDHLMRPHYRLLDALLADDHDGFNTALARALVLFAEYHASSVKPRLPTAVLGLACLAHDRGIPITVESDYLSRRVIEDLSPR